MASVTLRAFAKINLSLRVAHGAREGFHDVQTILQAISLFDGVTCESRRGPFELRCDMAGVPTDRTNLAWKAAQLLWEAAARGGEPRDAVVTLKKKIPDEGGPWRRQQQRGCNALGPAQTMEAAPARRANPRAGSEARLRRAVLSPRGHRARAGPRRRALSARTSAAILGRAGHPAIRRRHDGCYRWFDEKKGSGAFFAPRPEKGSRFLFPLFPVRSSTTSRRQSSSDTRDRPVEATAYGRRSNHGCNVGQRLDGVWRLHVGGCCPSRSTGGAKRRRPGRDHAISRQVYRRSR